MDKSIDQNPDIAVGVGLPFRRGNMGYFNQEFTTLDQVKANIKNLLLTMKGERIMQPTFGTEIYSILFEQDDGTLSIRVEESVLEAFKIWLPFVKVENMEIKYVIQQMLVIYLYLNRGVVMNN